MKHDDIALAHRSARANLEFVLNQEDVLKHTIRGKQTLNDARSMLARLKKGEEFTPNQLSFTTTLYERTMKALGLESCPTTHDNVRKS